ncbi:hypothetical protein MFIFM68171_09687 [Madurella fahalii]|uniref:Uncharacterized protein n=1 Tax=Madurella fahalii TaxID=1157608 RepID=A0ABQ0GP24_9PEZI
MSRTGFTFVSQRIETEKAIKRIGTASINLNVLSFPHSKTLSLENVERLKRVFRLERGCRPDELPNRIPAIIDENPLHQCLNLSGLSLERLQSAVPGDHAKLEFPRAFRLECLRGRHRVEAARHTPPYTEKRWIVDLYPANISKELKYALIDEYTNERKPDDGEFYYKIREFQGVFGTKNPYFEMRWWARLATASESTNRKERLEQLLNHAQFAPAFDAFRHIPALYGGMRLSAINKMVCLKCHDLLLFCLGEIRDFYYFVFGNDEDAMRRVTRADVEALHLTAPGACEAEAQALFGRIKAGELLKAFSDRERDDIWARLRSATTDCLVPSLFAFFENLKYLKGPADCMKRLIRPKRGETIFSALEGGFSDLSLPSGRCPIQVSRTNFKYARANAANRLDLLYRQLWLVAFREYRAVPNEGKKKLAGPIAGETDETVLFEFASLAQKFGFHSEEIHDLAHRDPDREMAYRFLKTVRKPDQYRYENPDECVTQIVNVIQEAEPVQDEDGTMDIDIDEHEKPPNRCGVPNDADQLRDRSSIFLDQLHRPLEQQGTSLSSFFIQRSIYFSFFGKELGVNLGDLEDSDGDFEFNNHRAQGRRKPSRPRNTGETLQLEEQPDRLSELEAQERGYRERLDAARAEVQQLDAKVQLLTSKQSEQQTRLEQLEQSLPETEERLRKTKKEVHDLESHVQSLKNEEVDLTRQVDQLRAEEASQQHRVGQLQNLQQGLEEQIRTNRLVIGTQNTSARAEEERQGRLRRLAEKLQELETRKLAKQSSLEKLNAEECERKARVDQLSAKENDLHTRTERLATAERELQSAVDELAAKEIEQRKRIKEQQQQQQTGSVALPEQS